MRWFGGSLLAAAVILHAGEIWLGACEVLPSSASPEYLPSAWAEFAMHQAGLIFGIVAPVILIGAAFSLLMRRPR